MTSVINLGLVKAIQVALTPPTNINQLWYDDNVGIKILKYYNTFTSAWESIIPPAPGTAAWGSISTGTGIPSQTDLVSYLNGNYLKLSGGTMLGNIVMSNGIFLSGTSTITPSFGSLTYSNTISLSEFHTGVKGMVLKTIKNSNTAAFTSISTGEFIDIRASSSVGVVSVISIDPAQTQIFTQGAGGFSSVGIYTPVQVQFSVSGTNATNLRLTSTELSLRTNLANGFALLKGTNLTIDRTFEFPDKDGTFAMLSDIVGGTVTASNGLTATGTNITLGGTLTNDTAIDGAYNFSIGNTIPGTTFIVSTAIAGDRAELDLFGNSIGASVSNSTTGAQSKLALRDDSSVLQFYDGTSLFSYLGVTIAGVSVSTDINGLIFAYLRADNLTTSRTYQFPDKNGTFAMLSDIVGSISASNGLTYTSGNVTLGGSLTGDTSIDGTHSLLMGQTTPLINFKIKNLGLFTVVSDDGAGNVSSIIQAPGTFVAKYTNGTINSAIELQTNYIQSTYYDGTNTSIIRSDSGGVAIQTNTANSFYAYLRSDNLTAIRTYQFTDSSGTLLISGGVNTLTANTTIEGAFQFIAGGVTPLTVHRITTSLANVLTNINSTYTSSVVVSTNNVNISSFDSSVSHTSFLTTQSEYAIMSYNDGFTITSSVQVDTNGIGISTNNSTINFAYLKSDILTANRILQFQDKSGIIALTSDFLGNYIAKTTTYLAVITDDTIECTSGTFTVTLFTAVGNTGKKLYIKNSGTGVVTIAANSGETIDGSTTITLVAGDGRVLVSNGSGWIKF